MTPPDPLLAVVQAVPMRCADCGMATTQDLPCPASAAHAWETDDAAIVRAVRAWLRSVEPTQSQVIDAMYESSDAVRALYREAWGDEQ